MSCYRPLFSSENALMASLSLSAAKKVIQECEKVESEILYKLVTYIFPRARRRHSRSLPRPCANRMYRQNYRNLLLAYLQLFLLLNILNNNYMNNIYLSK